MSSYRAAAKGAVTIGAATTLSSIVLPSLIRRLSAELPDVRLRLEEGVTSDLLESLRLGRLDLVLVVLPLDPEGFEIVTTGSLELFFILPLSHRFAGRESIDLREFEHEHWVTFAPSNPARRWVEDNCCRAGFRPKVTAVVDTMNQLKAFVEGGHGVGLLPREVVALEVQASRLVAVPASGTRPTIQHGYLFAPSEEPSPAAARVRALVEAELRDLSPVELQR